jgi:hypothetical protein
LRRSKLPLPLPLPQSPYRRPPLHSSPSKNSLCLPLLAPAVQLPAPPPNRGRGGEEEESHVSVPRRSRSPERRRGAAGVEAVQAKPDTRGRLIRLMGGEAVASQRLSRAMSFGGSGWIPEEALHLVMGYVDDPGDREAVSLVCHLWHRLPSLLAPRPCTCSRRTPAAARAAPCRLAHARPALACRRRHHLPGNFFRVWVFYSFVCSAQSRREVVKEGRFSLYIDLV